MGCTVAPSGRLPITWQATPAQDRTFSQPPAVPVRTWHALGVSVGVSARVGAVSVARVGVSVGLGGVGGAAWLGGAVIGATITPAGAATWQASTARPMAATAKRGVGDVLIGRLPFWARKMPGDNPPGKRGHVTCIILL